MNHGLADPVVRYRRLVQRAQVDGRVPALSVALHRADRPLWTYQVGAQPRTRFRPGSVTKTFTAVLVLQCRDDGLLDLDDPIGRHLDLPRHGELAVRRLLSHTSGLQREPFGDMWDTLDVPDVGRLLGDLGRAERVLPPARRYHYSNLGYALLGYLVEPHSDHARPEPPLDMGALAPAAQLWGTAADLARWGAFLADPAKVDPDGAVLAPATLDEMRWPLTMSDETLWKVGFGLGLILVDEGERRIDVGHDGAMPGFLAGVYGRRGTGTPPALGVAVLGASGTATGLLELPHALLAAAVEHDPAEIEPWRPGGPPPDHLRTVLGRWWSEGYEHVFFWREGRLHARMADAPADRPPAVFEETGPDVLRTVCGREAGELLRLTRDPAGAEVGADALGDLPVHPRAGDLRGLLMRRRRAWRAGGRYHGVTQLSPTERWPQARVADP